ncbi:hypothetical protein [Bradyrhizobium sp. JYMT SZCCT0428]|uniref:hypothetical protein n=1 Tax=Bradyrhizobium sp. JYMT SZCCT0428 TaxID=2807673 RepID=UPI001BAAA28D|nr:hypothetical protein [Bradyrhizobium sp. JYMT SZCCT0428]MBR1155271.1 hypothetical protein [Bradyrhizobium sp. JYMT SZCCT0428]
MDYQAFTNDSLTLMHEGIRGALASDHAVECQVGDSKFKVRDTLHWKKRAADLEAQMLKRGMSFVVIDWHERQEKLPFS